MSIPHAVVCIKTTLRNTLNVSDFFHECEVKGMELPLCVERLWASMTRTVEEYKKVNGIKGEKLIV